MEKQMKNLGVVMWRNDRHERIFGIALSYAAMSTIWFTSCKKFKDSKKKGLAFESVSLSPLTIVLAENCMILGLDLVDCSVRDFFCT